MHYTIKRYKYPNYKVEVYTSYWFKLLYKLDERMGILANDSGDYNPMSINDVAAYLDIEISTAKRFLQESVELGVITKRLEKVFKQKRNVFSIQVEYSLGLLEYS